MMSRKKKSVDVYWLLSEADLPPGLKFEADKDNEGHYFLTVTEKMLVEQLVTKLTFVSYRLTVIKRCRQSAMIKFEFSKKELRMRRMLKHSVISFGAL